MEEVHRKNKYITIIECPYCANKSFIKISEVEGRGLPSDIVICEHCDGCFKSSILNNEANRYYYEKISYILRGKALSEKGIEKLFRKRVREFATGRYYFISHFIKLNRELDFIVELGCNDGANLFPWFKNGFSVLGIELDSIMVEFGCKKGLNLTKADFMEYNFTDQKPKLIILSHFLEHVGDVNITLIKLLKILQPNGYLFIEVPGIKTQGVVNSLSYFDIEHNYNFDLGSLTRLLKKYHFRIIYADDYMRVLCTPLQAQNTTAQKYVALSIEKIKAYALKRFINMFNFKEGTLLGLLQQGATNNFKIRIINKLKALYYKYYYASIVKSEKKNTKIKL